jgi:hypothetical protein
MKNSSAIQKQAPSWNIHGQHRRRRLRRNRKECSEEEDEIVGKTWRDFKAMAGNRISWQCSVEALCPEMKYQELTLVD